MAACLAPGHPAHCNSCVTAGLLHHTGCTLAELKAGLPALQQAFHLQWLPLPRGAFQLPL